MSTFEWIFFTIGLIVPMCIFLFFAVVACGMNFWRDYLDIKSIKDKQKTTKNNDRKEKKDRV